jgi:hypothetical protein
LLRIERLGSGSTIAAGERPARSPALCVTPVAADEDMYDGPTAIKPLAVKPQPQH